MAIARLSRNNPTHSAVWASVVVLFVVTGVARGDGRVWPYFTVVLICTAIGAAVDGVFRFSPMALWLLVLTGTMHLAGGLIPAPTGDGVLYGTWVVPQVLRFDQLVHAIGSGTATVVGWQMLGAWLATHAPLRAHAWLAVLAGLGMGAINEVIEFVAAARAPTYVGGFQNTGWDLVFNVVGVAAAAVFLVLTRAPTRPVTIGEPAVG